MKLTRMLTDRGKHRRHDEGAPAPQPQARLGFDDQDGLVIDLREEAPAGAPVCPHCGDPARLEELDEVAGLAFYACTGCGFTFRDRLARPR